MTGFEEEVKEGVKVAPAQGPGVSQRLGRGALKETGNPEERVSGEGYGPHRRCQGRRGLAGSPYRMEAWPLHCDPHRSDPSTPSFFCIPFMRARILSPTLSFHFSLFTL